jgi:hypothetical protein
MGNYHSIDFLQLSTEKPMGIPKLVNQWLLSKGNPMVNQWIVIVNGKIPTWL